MGCDVIGPPALVMDEEVKRSEGNPCTQQVGAWSQAATE